MKIAASALQLSSSHSESTRREVRERLRIWTGPASGERTAGQDPAAAAAVSLSEAGKARQSADAVEAAGSAADHDPLLNLLRAIIEALTGRRIEVFDAAELNPQASSPEVAAAGGGAAPLPNFGLEYARQESYSESESTQFGAAGVVLTADGREIRFSLELTMQRSFQSQTDVSLRLGNAVKKDPLVINFAGTAAQLSDRKFSIDIDADGSAETAHFLTSGSGFLVFDRDANGRIDNGREMFGALSGDGFADLAALDGDRNGWLDEADQAYQELRVWSMDAAGTENLMTLAEAGVGAISLARVASPFALKDTGNAERGEIRSTGIYLREDGSAGTMQQIDLSV